MITRLLEKRRTNRGPRWAELGREAQVHLLPLARQLARPADPLEPGVRTLGVVGSRSGEGASTVARELAVLLAGGEKRAVLLVDANFAFPAVQRGFGLAGSSGLADALLADPPAEPSIVESDVPQLSLLPSGNPGIDPAAALASPRLAELLQEWREEFELVLIDLPPVLDQPAAVSLAGRCDAVVLVVEADRTAAADALEVAELLQRSGARVLGAVLNKAPNRQG